MRTLAGIRGYTTLSVETTTINDLVHWVNNDQLVLDRPSQGAFALSEDAQSVLVNAVYKGLPLPGIVTCEVEPRGEDDQAMSYNVLYGRDRLTAYKNFMDGMIPATKLGHEVGQFYIHQLDHDGTRQIEASFGRTQIQMTDYDYMDQESQFKLFNDLHKDTAVPNSEETQEEVPSTVHDVTPATVQEGNPQIHGKGRPKRSLM